ncbi:hypothetical protein ACKKBF_B10240 [Auxenochlorella protothecoides x Auxenochlorella symbiontica]
MPKLRLLQSLEGHDDRVWHVAWSPPGDTLASCSGDKTVRIWRRSQPGSDTWHCTAILEDVHSRTIRSCCWSPTGSHLATASFDRTVAIWEVKGAVWEMTTLLEGHESEVKDVAWSPDGGLLATCSRDKTVWVWESAPGDEYEVLDVKHGHTQDVKTVRWHPGGEVLVSASYDDSMKLWVGEDDEWVCAQTLSGPGIGHNSTVWDLSFESTGKFMVSCSDDRTLKIWACKSGSRQDGPRWQLATTLRGDHSRTIFSVDWSRCAPLIASGGADNSICIHGVGGAASASPPQADANAMPSPPGSDSGPGSGPSLAPGLKVRSLFMPEHGFQAPPVEKLAVTLSHKEAAAHASDTNCVRWHPTIPGLLASAGDDGILKLWQYDQEAEDDAS